MTQTVVVISIGPVQGFIAAARRMRDFAYGSRLLVELARLTAAQLKAQGSFTIIFPAQPEKDAPNKIVALYRGDTAKLPAILHGVHAELIAYLRRLMDAQITALNKRAGDKLALPAESTQRAIAQIADVLEFFWAFASHERYADALQKAENSLAARKSLRNVAAFPMGANLPKSSLTGHYESVIPEQFYNLNGGNAKRFRFAYGVRNAERLSGIDLLKRHGSFPNLHTIFTSVALMAARGALQRAGVRTQDANGQWHTNQAFNDAWRPIDAMLEYCESDVQGNGKPFDASEYAECLFEGRIAEFVDNPTELKQVTADLKELLKKHNVSTDKPYYALLLADGDRMGKLISACTTVAKDESQHIAFSKALSEFADDVKGVITRHDGEAIYTGGDDVLAIVPVPCAIACAEQIQELFAAKLSPIFDAVKSAIDDEEARNAGPSVSIGVAILHHMEPLSDAMEMVRSAEKAAKKSRSALAVTVSKRSGSDITISGLWDSKFIKRMTDLIKDLKNGDLPDGYAYELRDLIRRLHPDNDAHQKHAKSADIHTLAQILLLEEERILKRKKDAQGKTVDVKQISAIRAAMYTATPAGKAAFAHMTEWVNEIIVARELV